jgi:tripeptidyl-peptidase-1
VSNSDPLPYIFSISYQDLEPTLSPPYMEAVSTEFKKLGARGVTLLTGSGDWGTECTPDCQQFQPDFPSSSPFIVSTGATYFVPFSNATEAGLYPSLSLFDPSHLL